MQPQTKVPYVFVLPLMIFAFSHLTLKFTWPLFSVSQLSQLRRCLAVAPDGGGRPRPGAALDGDGGLHRPGAARDGSRPRSRRPPPPPPTRRRLRRSDDSPRRAPRSEPPPRNTSASTSSPTRRTSSTTWTTTPGIRYWVSLPREQILGKPSHDAGEQILDAARYWM